MYEVKPSSKLREYNYYLHINEKVILATDLPENTLNITCNEPNKHVKLSDLIGKVGMCYWIESALILINKENIISNLSKKFVEKMNPYDGLTNIYTELKKFNEFDTVDEYWFPCNEDGYYKKN
jgi:hypothetical protein